MRLKAIEHRLMSQSPPCIVAVAWRGSLFRPQKPRPSPGPLSANAKTSSLFFDVGHCRFYDLAASPWKSILRFQHSSENRRYWSGGDLFSDVRIGNEEVSGYDIHEPPWILSMQDSLKEDGDNMRSMSIKKHEMQIV